MPRVPRNHHVVRRLDFGGSRDDLAKLDNFANSMKEAEARERQEMTAKYNFDFKNEVALRGNYLWMKRNGDEWALMEPKETFDMNENERTPLHSRDAVQGVPPARRKRRAREEREICNNHVKKRLTLE